MEASTAKKNLKKLRRPVLVNLLSRQWGVNISEHETLGIEDIIDTGLKMLRPSQNLELPETADLECLLLTTGVTKRTWTRFALVDPSNKRKRLNLDANFLFKHLNDSLSGVSRDPAVNVIELRPYNAMWVRIQISQTTNTSPSYVIFSTAAPSLVMCGPVGNLTKLLDAVQSAFQCSEVRDCSAKAADPWALLASQLPADPSTPAPQFSLEGLSFLKRPREEDSSNSVAIVNLDLQEENERNLKLLNMGSHTSQKVPSKVIETCVPLQSECADPMGMVSLGPIKLNIKFTGPSVNTGIRHMASNGQCHHWIAEDL